MDRPYSSHARRYSLSKIPPVTSVSLSKGRHRTDSFSSGPPKRYERHPPTESSATAVQTQWKPAKRETGLKEVQDHILAVSRDYKCFPKISMFLILFSLFFFLSYIKHGSGILMLLLSKLIKNKNFSIYKQAFQVRL